MAPAYQSHYDQSHALIIGIDDYESLSPLETAVKDAQAVAGLLEHDLGFDVHLLLNDAATRSAILNHIEWLTTSNPDDRVIIYFAGHGITRRTTTGNTIGMLVPYGVERDQYYDFIEMDYLISRSEFIPAKHILFVLDACFGGLALTTRSAPQESALATDLMTRRAVQAIAAGQEDQLVADRWGIGGHSIFTGLLLEKLSDRGAMLTGNELGLYLQRQVGQHTRSRQTPHYGHLLGSGGDFVFWLDPEPVEESGLPSDIVSLLQSRLPGARSAGVHELIGLVVSTDPELAKLARAELERIAAEDPDHEVSQLAEHALRPPDTAPPPFDPVPSPSPPDDQHEWVIKRPPTPFFRRWWRFGAALYAGLSFILAVLLANSLYTAFSSDSLALIRLLATVVWLPGVILWGLIARSHWQKQRKYRALLYVLNTISTLAAGLILIFSFQ